MFSKQMANLVANFGCPMIIVDINSTIFSLSISYFKIVDYKSDAKL